MVEGFRFGCRILELETPHPKLETLNPKLETPSAKLPPKQRGP